MKKTSYNIKPSHLDRICLKTKEKKKKKNNINYAFDNYKEKYFSFITKEATSMLDKNRWIVDSKGTKYTTLYKCLFYTYQ